MTEYDTFLRGIDEALSAPVAGGASSWAASVNRRTLEHLRADATAAALASQRQVKLRFYEGAIYGNAGHVHLLLRSINELNETVIAAANNLLHRPYMTITEEVRRRFGLLALPAGAGSFVMQIAASPLPDARPRALRVPEGSGDEGTIPELSSVPSPTSEALQRVIEVMRAATASDASGDQIEARLQSLTRSGITHLSRMMARIEAGDYSVDVTELTPGVVSETVSDGFTFRSRDATWLRKVIANRSLDAVEREVTGVLLTASRVRNVFDIVDDEDRTISGTLDSTLRASLVPLFDTRVVARYEERLDPADAMGDRLVRRLLAISPADEP